MERDGNGSNEEQGRERESKITMESKEEQGRAKGEEQQRSNESNGEQRGPKLSNGE